MTQGFQRFTKRYANVLGVFIGVAVVSSILLNSSCGSTSPTTPTRPPVQLTSTITSPTAGAIIETETTVSITGTASATGGGTVTRVEVSVDGGATFSAATGTTSWSFTWMPTMPGPVRVRSRAVDNSGTSQDPPAEIAVTVRDTKPPTSTITSPKAGAVVLTGAAVGITGTASDAGGGTVARVEVSVDGGATFSAATGTTAWSFNWTPAPGQATIRSRAVDNSGNQQNPPAQITVTVIQDTTPPTSAITSPKEGADISPGTTVSITGTASDAGGGSVARVEVSVNGGETFSPATGTTAWSFAWTPTLGPARIISRAVDNSGNLQAIPAEITVTVVVGGAWTAQGPGPSRDGQVENVTPNNEVVGAIHTVAAHPTDANILYVGGVNGGIWRTGNAKAASPNWTPLTDNFPSLSIGALEFDPTDATHQTLVAGIGRFSSSAGFVGRLLGILRTTDGGDNWTQISHPLLVIQNISGIAARGSTLLASANPMIVVGGLFRSIDGGTNWVLVSGSNGLPAGGVSDLVGDPNNPNRFYVTVQRTGIFRSDNGGETWTNISSGDPTLNGIITNDFNVNAEMAVASNGRLYVIVEKARRASYIGFIDNPAADAPAWTAMDLPQTRESDGDPEGIHPGGQGDIHLSIAVDPNDPNTVYVGGDRQDGPFLNFIGANTFSGRLFRGDTTVAATGQIPSPQWEHLTHSNSITQIPGGGTANGSAPHAGSRDMVIDASGDLIEVDEGGVYRRTSPQNNTGDWVSINGDIQTTELHDVAYDTNSNIILGGAQGAGSSQQITTDSTTWRSVSGGDGGDVAVDNITLAASNQSIRYSSSVDMGFRRETYDADNKRIGDPVFPALTVVSDGTTLQPRRVALMELNAIDPRRLVISGLDSVHSRLTFIQESLDQGDTITQINGPVGIPFTPFAMAYGGRSGGVDNLDVLYVCVQITTSTDSGPAVLLRTTAGAPLTQTAEIPTDAFEARDVVMDPDDWRSAYVVVNNQVFRTTDAGASWTDITGNLTQFGARDFRTIMFVAGDSRDLLLIGTNAGVFVSFSSSGFTSWNKLGIGLPNTLVWDLDYDVADDVLVAGTLGRGAWTITNLRGLTGQTAQP
jgi:Big-like domain-containing protein